MCFLIDIHNLVKFRSLKMKQLAIFSFLHFVSGNDLIYGSLLKTLRGENVSTNALIGLGKVFPYVFPNSTNCIQAAIDDSMFAQKILKLICASGLSPSIVRIGKDASGKPIGKIYCNFFLILSLDVQGMIQLLPELPKAADHRILTFIKSGDVDHLGSFLNNRTALFGDAQVLVSLLKNTSIAFKLDQPTRIFTKEIIDNNVWEVRLKGIMDFKGRQIKVATFNCTFFSRLGPTQENGEPTFADGFEISVFKEILKRINATYKVVPMKENEKFGKFVNGSYVNGLFGKIIHGLVDIGFCGSLIDANKTSLNLEMSDPTLLSCFKYAVHRPDEISKSFTTVLRPFGLDTWLTLISTILAMSVVLLVFANVDHNKIKKYKNLGNCLLTLVGTLVNGSWPKLKKYLGPLRHVIAWWIVFTLLITTSYTSKLVSELATTRYDRKPNYIKEFLKEDFYWPITAQPYAGVFDMNSEKYKAWLKRVKIVESNELNNLLKHDRKAVILTQQIRGKSFVFNHEIDEEVLERYETVDHCLTYSFIGFIYRSGSPFNKAFDHHLINLMETGVTYYKFRRIIARMLRGRSSIYSLKETSRAHKPLKATPLKMEHLNGVFDILFFGLFISLMVFIFENVYVKYIKK